VEEDAIAVFNMMLSLVTPHPQLIIKTIVCVIIEVVILVERENH
jgi:hypothetical protein